jgi:hypothetical protein
MNMNIKIKEWKEHEDQYQDQSGDERLEAS